STKDGEFWMLTFVSIDNIIYVDLLLDVLQIHDKDNKNSM
ncbi:hypothetical protein HMPREF9148_00187, partial [Prevotella sp. F0091]